MGNRKVLWKRQKEIHKIRATCVFSDEIVIKPVISF